MSGYVRTPVTLSTAVSGTLYARLRTGDNPRVEEPHMPSGFKSVGVSIPGCAATLTAGDPVFGMGALTGELHAAVPQEGGGYNVYGAGFYVITSLSNGYVTVDGVYCIVAIYEPGDPEYDEISAFGDSVKVWPVVAEASAAIYNPDGLPNPQGVQTAQERYYIAWHFDIAGIEPGYWVNDTQEIEVSWSMGSDGLVLKRKWEASPPTARQHMHPRDCAVTDAWHFTPAATFNASLGGVSVEAGPRRLLYPGDTDAEIGDAYLGDPPVRFTLERSGDVKLDLVMGRVSIDGWDFTGKLYHKMFGGGGQSVDHQVRGSSAGAEMVPTGDAVAGDIAFTFWGIAYPPMNYGWQQETYLWDDDEPVTPELEAGFVNADGSPKLGLLSSSGEPPMLFSTLTGWVPGYPTSVDLRPRNFQTQFTVNVREWWALNQLCCPERAHEGEALEEVLHDRYVTLEVPGVDAGTGVPGEPYRRALISAAARETALLPPVASKDTPPVAPRDRFALTGDLPAYRDPDPGKLLRFVFPPAAFADGAWPHGDVSLIPQTRYWARLALLPRQLGEGFGKVWEWPWYLRALAAGEAVSNPGDPREPAYAEDPFSWKDYAFLRVRVRKPMTAELSCALQVEYSTVTITDPHYTSGYWRAEGWEHVRSQHTAMWPLTFPAESGPGEPGAGTEVGEEAVAELVVDLLLPSSGGQVPQLFVVDRWTIEDFGFLPQAPPASDMALELVSLDLLPDPAGSLAVAKTAEAWDFQADWEQVLIEHDGTCKVARLPDEPHRNAGPEQGLGYIQAWQHSPDFTGEPSQLDVARAASYGYGQLAQFQGWTAVWEQGAVNAMTRSYWKGAGDPEVLCEPLFYWLAPYVREGDDDEFELRGAVRVCQLTIARGTPAPYLLHVRKQLGGSCWAFCLTEDGARWTPDQLAGGEQLVIWRRFAYTDEDGAAIAYPGSPLPAASTWLWYKTAGVAERLTTHGILRFPGLLPSSTRINNPTKSQSDLSAQTDRAVVTYWAPVWRSSAWQSFDPNDAAELAEMRAHTDWVGEIGPFGNVQPRMVVYQAARMGVVPGLQGGNLVRMRVVSEALTRGGKVWTRKGLREAWTERLDTVTDGPMLLHQRQTDDLALLDGGTQQSRTHGQTWAAGLPQGVPAAAARWPELLDRMYEARLGRHDHLGAAVGVAESGANAEIRVAGMGETASLVAVVPLAELGGLPAWPWLTRLSTGHWVVGCFVNGVYREWVSASLDGTGWEAAPELAAGDWAKLSCASFWRCRDGSELVAGHCPDVGRIHVLRRPGPGALWHGPYLEAAADPAFPYVIERPTGWAECGWLTGAGVWVRYEAARASGSWAVVT
ncbi:MAG: hypothetical protein HYU66_25575 [Armatimonadetes bacterium]|nr:hypothetical protein [Armatimonadota bacterium]